MSKELIFFKKYIFIFLELFHVFIEFIPLIILFGIIKSKLIFYITLIIFLIIPLHWVFFNNECILTKLSNKLNGIKKKETFVERRFIFIGQFLSKFFNNKTPKESILLFTSIINLINISILWYILFYKIDCF
jgi:hypothetical protein